MAQAPDVSAILQALAQKNGGAPPNGQPSPAPGGYMNNNGTPVSLNPAGYPLAPPPVSNEPDLSHVAPASKGILMNNLGDAIAKAQAAAKARGVGADRGREGDRPYSQSRNRSRSPQRGGGRDSYNPYRDERRDEARRGGYGRERSFSPDRSGFNFSSRDSPRETRGPVKEESASETITVDSSSVGLIIGRGGDSMRRIEQESGARVQFMQDQSQPRRQCRITGTKHQRSEAIAEIFRVANSEQAASGNAAPSKQTQSHQGGRSNASSGTQPAEGENNTQIWVPDRTVGLIIGRGGETIRDLQERSGCHVNITAKEQSENNFRPVNLIGNQRTATLARKLIDEIVQSDTRGGAGPSQDSPWKTDDYRGGQGLMPNISGYQNYGAPPQYSNAFGGEAPPNGGGDGKITDTTIVPSEAVGMIIGKGGETIKDMQNTSNCKINVDPAGQPDIDRRIELIGTPPNIATAKNLIWEKVQTVREKQGGSFKGQQQDNPHAQQAPYGQMPPMQAQFSMPSAPGAAPGGQAGHPLDTEYAAYGGFDNFRALWAAAERNGSGTA